MADVVSGMCVCVCLQGACHKGHEGVVCVLLQHGAQVHHAALDGYTALHNAALKVGRNII
jgi:ankyrin repeat protein